MHVRAFPYIGIGIQKLISLLLLENLSPKNSLSICYTPEDFSQGAVEGFRPFLISWWVFPLLRLRFFLYRLFYLWWFCSGLALNVRLLLAGRVPTMELYAWFWDVLSPRCIPICFEKFLSLGFWF